MDLEPSGRETRFGALNDRHFAIRVFFLRGRPPNPEDLTIELPVSNGHRRRGNEEETKRKRKEYERRTRNDVGNSNVKNPYSVRVGAPSVAN